MGIMDKFSLEGKVGIVTGSSKGLGRGMALALAEAGADIVVASRSKDKLKQVVEEIEGLGQKGLAVPTDVSKREDLEELVDITVDEFDRIDFLFNNAGIIRRASSEEHTEEDWDTVIDVNLKSVFLLSKLVAQQMIEQGGGKIINTSSVISVSGGKTIPSYSASKGGISQLTKTMANDLAEYNINVNAIGPGYFETELTEPLVNDEERSEAILSRIPLDRWGKPEDLGGVAVFLASEASDYMTGTTVYVDGGWLS